MVNPDHWTILRESSKSWDAWREANPDTAPDFTQADLTGVFLWSVDLHGALLTRATLNGANLHGATFWRANLREARLVAADLTRTNLIEADLTGANLAGANLAGANLTGANLAGANLAGANLTYCALVETDLRGADLTGCRVYGISAWNITLDEHTKQRDLVITREQEPRVTVDNLQFAQFLYLLLTGPGLRDVIDTIVSKAVLILGRFTEERKKVLDAIRDKLREMDYLPILFDFDGPSRQNVVGTVKTVGMLARFVIADLTDAKAVDQELQSILSGRKVPIQPLLLDRAEVPAGMLEGLLQKYSDTVLPVYVYRDAEQLTAKLRERVVAPANETERWLASQTRREIVYVRDDGDV